MAIFKCKMCGGELNITADMKIIECDYCGTKQTVPALDNEKKINLFNRANRLRLNSEFDKASAIYESIIAEFPQEVEAYWGLCLCNYGIEYVDDPATAKKVPTCHRASFDKFVNDDNFKFVVEHSDLLSRQLYLDEAKEIDRIMESILSVSKNEKPYDVFICYKETDMVGNRTIDSVLAQDIYDALTAKGLKVFFARITLEDKLGQMYEPYIFAALNSAKVMLCIGTNPDYFEAAWVRNEWSRFLKIMAKDKSKVLIPCFKDIGIADLPTQFRALQAQDMGKIGFIQDLLRGVQKIIGDKSAVNDQSTPETSPASNPRAMPIKAIHSKGALSKDDFFPKTQISSTINMDQYPYIAFNLFVNKFQYTGVAELTLKVFDSNNNMLTNSTVKINVNPSIDKLGQIWTMKGSTGSDITPGKYKACFSVNGGPVSEYNFEVVNNSTASNANPASTPNPASNPRAMPIKAIHSMGTLSKVDFFPKTPISSTINMDQYPYIAFNLFVNKFQYTGVAELTLKVFDSNNNMLTNSTVKINVNPSIDKLGQIWIMKGDAGSDINPGKYKACFSVNGGPVSEYNFEVVNNSIASNANPFGTQPMFNNVVNNDSALSNSNKQSKSLMVYIVLALLGGVMGLHCFYVGDKKKALHRILLSITVIGAILSILLSWADIFKALTSGEF